MSTIISQMFVYNKTVRIFRFEINCILKFILQSNGDGYGRSRLPRSSHNSLRCTEDHCELDCIIIIYVGEVYDNIGLIRKISKNKIVLY